MSGQAIAPLLITAGAAIGGTAIGALSSWGIQRWQAKEAAQQWRRDVMLTEAKTVIAAVQRFEAAVTHLATDMNLETLAEVKHAESEASNGCFAAIVPLTLRTAAEVGDWMQGIRNELSAVAAATGEAERMAVITAASDSLTTISSRAILTAKQDLGFTQDHPRLGRIPDADPRLAQPDA